MPRTPIDSDPGVIAAREAAAHRAELAEQLADALDVLRSAHDAARAARPAELTPTNAIGAAALVDLAGNLAHLTRAAADARDLCIMLARSAPVGRPPSWQQLADALGEPDRNNLARRFRRKGTTTDE